MKGPGDTNDTRLYPWRADYDPYGFLAKVPKKDFGHFPTRTNISVGTLGKVWNVHESHQKKKKILSRYK